MFKRFLLVLLLILFSSNTFAEENNVTEPEKKEKGATKFEDIVVTATRTEKERGVGAGKRKCCHEKGNGDKEYKDS